MSNRRKCPNSFHWSLAGRKRWDMFEPPVLRQHVPGEPDVPDLVHRGDWWTAWSGRGAIIGQGLVVDVVREVGLPGLECVYYRVVYIPERNLRLRNRPSEEVLYSNSTDVVAQGGRLVALFEADLDTYTAGRPPADLKIPVWAHRILDARRQLRLV